MKTWVEKKKKKTWVELSEVTYHLDNPRKVSWLSRFVVVSQLLIFPLSEKKKKKIRNVGFLTYRSGSIDSGDYKT